MKNMVLGAPLAAPPKVTPRWSDKRKFHVGMRMMQVNMMLTAQKLRPFWGAAVIDGYEGMEGNGPHQGTPVPHRIAIASTDYIAADRVGVEAMGIDPNSVGSLVYSHQDGLGQYDLDKIDIRGEKVADVRRAYRLHPDVERRARVDEADGGAAVAARSRHARVYRAGLLLIGPRAAAARRARTRAVRARGDGIISAQAARGRRWVVT